jgi:hypothetical protein
MIPRRDDRAGVNAPELSRPGRHGKGTATVTLKTRALKKPTRRSETSRRRGLLRDSSHSRMEPELEHTPSGRGEETDALVGGAVILSIADTGDRPD